MITIFLHVLQDGPAKTKEIFGKNIIEEWQISAKKNILALKLLGMAGFLAVVEILSCSFFYRFRDEHLYQDYDRR
jgi:hypothetical protein